MIGNDVFVLVICRWYYGGCANLCEQVLQLQKLEVLAREEMLHLVSDLLEGNHPELFAEFKRMVNEAVSHFPRKTAYRRVCIVYSLVESLE